MTDHLLDTLRYTVGKQATVPLRAGAAPPRDRGYSAHSYRLCVEEITAAVDAIWPDTRAVAQPWFKDWEPPRTPYLEQFDSMLKGVYSDMADSMRRQMYGGLGSLVESGTLHVIADDASPWWKASRLPWWRRLRGNTRGGGA